MVVLEIYSTQYQEIELNSGFPQSGKNVKMQSKNIQVQGPASAEEQPHASVQAWSGPAGDQLCGEGPGCAGGRQVDHEPAVCPRCQEGKWDPGMH